MTLLNSVSSSALDSAKKSLILQVNDKAKAQDKEEEVDGKQSKLEVDHRFFIPDDPHLQRLKELTTRIKEEKMLSELKADAIKARFDEAGEIKIDLSQNSDRDNPRNKENSFR